MRLSRAELWQRLMTVDAALDRRYPGDSVALAVQCEQLRAYVVELESALRARSEHVIALERDAEQLRQHYAQARERRRGVPYSPGYVETYERSPRTNASRSHARAPRRP